MPTRSDLNSLVFFRTNFSSHVHTRDVLHNQLTTVRIVHHDVQSVGACKVNSAVGPSQQHAMARKAPAHAVMTFEHQIVFSRANHLASHSTGAQCPGIVNFAVSDLFDGFWAPKTPFEVGDKTPPPPESEDCLNIARAIIEGIFCCILLLIHSASN